MIAMPSATLHQMDEPHSTASLQAGARTTRTAVMAMAAVAAVVVGAAGFTRMSRAQVGEGVVVLSAESAAAHRHSNYTAAGANHSTQTTSCDEYDDDTVYTESIW